MALLHVSAMYSSRRVTALHLVDRLRLVHREQLGLGLLGTATRQKTKRNEEDMPFRAVRLCSVWFGSGLEHTKATYVEYTLRQPD